MFSLFKPTTAPKHKHPQLPDLDSTLYPMQWQSHCFLSANDLLLALLNSEDDCPTQSEISDILYKNNTYQDWINFTVFGRYVQRSFAVFYQQSEDVFNAHMPELLRHELMRHAQRLPVGQTLFFANQLPMQARQDKLFMTTLNPAMALADAREFVKMQGKKPTQIIINHVSINSAKVLAFAVRHNTRTRASLHNEVMILGFESLRLVKEQQLKTGQSKKVQKQIASTANDVDAIILRYYELR